MSWSRGWCARYRLKRHFVILEEYIYLVPHAVEKDYVFLKTIIPSRKATKAYKKVQEG